VCKIAAYADGDTTRLDPTAHVFETHSTGRHQSRLRQRCLNGLDERGPGGLTRKHLDDVCTRFHRFNDFLNCTGPRKVRNLISVTKFRRFCIHGRRYNKLGACQNGQSSGLWIQNRPCADDKAGTRISFRQSLDDIHRTRDSKRDFEHSSTALDAGFSNTDGFFRVAGTNHSNQTRLQNPAKNSQLQQLFPPVIRGRLPKSPKFIC